MAGPSIPFVQRLSLIVTIFRAIGSFLYGVFAPIPRRGYRLSTASSLFVRKLFFHTTPAQLQWLLPSTEAVYGQYSRFAGYKPSTVTLPSGAKAHWMGPRNAPLTILYMHGGGYFVPATMAHVKWLWTIHNVFRKQGKDVSICMMSYTLAPEGRFPTQLKQAVEVLRHLIDVEKLPASQIIIGGDSAGGNMAMSLLSHLLHPHPDVPELKLDTPLRGTLLVSPWIGFEHDESSDQKYPYDMLTYEAITKAASSVLGEQAPDNYTEAAKAPAAWWNGLDQLTESMYIWYGLGELLSPSIETFAAKVVDSVSLTKFAVPGGTHVSTIVDVLVPGSKGLDEGTLAWVREREARKAVQ